MINSIAMCCCTGNQLSFCPQALLRRLEKRIHVDLPSQEARLRMVTHMLADRGVHQQLLTSLSIQTAGHSGSDITSLCKEIAIRWASQPAGDDATQCILRYSHACKCYACTLPILRSMDTVPRCFCCSCCGYHDSPMTLVQSHGAGQSADSWHRRIKRPQQQPLLGISPK